MLLYHVISFNVSFSSNGRIPSSHIIVTLPVIPITCCDLTVLSETLSFLVTYTILLKTFTDQAVSMIVLLYSFRATCY